MDDTVERMEVVEIIWVKLMAFDSADSPKRSLTDLSV